MGEHESHHTLNIRFSILDVGSAFVSEVAELVFFGGSLDDIAAL